MVIYTISDLHLPLGIDKPMDIFGKRWENYVARLEENWRSVVTHEDVVVLGGDFSWATYLEQSQNDFDFLEALPGQKILLKGNHDYWWTTANKLREFTESRGYKTINFLHNNFYKTGTVGICGTRGWSLDSISDAENKKIYDREIIRLKLSLDAALSGGCTELLVFTHFPPVTAGNFDTAFHQTLKEYNVSKCIYGHLHGISHTTAYEGTLDGVEYILASGDYLEFKPLEIIRQGDN